MKYHISKIQIQEITPMKNKKSRGLGDSIEKVTKATGIKKVVKILKKKV